MRMRTGMLARRIALTAAVSLATLSAGGSPPSSAPADWWFCEDLGCGGGNLKCLETTVTVTECFLWDCWEIDVPATCYQSLR